MIEKETYYWGVLRITNPKTLQRWKDNGNYQKMIDQGFFYSPGCGRFRDHICECSKCRKKLKTNENG